MKSLNLPRAVHRALLPMALAMGALSSQVHAGDSITLIEMGDLHGTLVPHAAVLKNPDGSEREVASSGGLARLKTVVDSIRADNPEAVLLSTGDLTHGSAETMFTVGDAMMVPMNAFGIDVYTPGNWDFGYGAAVFRNRFASKPPFPTIPGNIRVMARNVGCNDIPVIEGLTDGTYVCSENTANTAPFPTPEGDSVIRASFPAVAVNLYNAAPLPTPLHGKRVLDAYKILDRNGVKIAVIGLTAAIVPQQADTFNIGLRFTQGVEELPGIIDEVKAQGAELIVVQSELGLSQNIKIAQSFSDIDVMYSAHTHEVTLGALLARKDKVLRTTPGKKLSRKERRQLRRGAAIVVETNRDMYVGRLDLEVESGQVVDFDWEAIPVDESVPEDPDMAALVAAMEEDFVSGEDGEVARHTFMPGGFGGNPSLRGLQLTDDLDTVVGYTDTLLLRHHVLEDTLNNFIADGILAVSDSVADVRNVPGWENGVDISMANGFRFGNAVLPGQPITLRDLYTWFPIAPAVNIADFSGQSIQNSLDVILNAVFNRNTFLQRGGWYLGLANMEQKIDLKNRPFSSSSGRIVETKIGGQPLDLGKRYVFASCYGHGNPLDDVCRTGGGANHKFFQLADPDDYTSAISLAEPVNKIGVIVGPTVQQVAPDNFLHPVHALRRYLDALPDNTVTEAEFGANRGRIVTVDSKNPGNLPQDPELQIGQPDNTPDPTYVQPPFGAGPAFFSGRIGEDN
ncbi:2',3'-cyclic-nucleotide 2'-phosphodiesterase (5'-nucleotidase family) [Thiogranum longum]|uniref:2',3'-cyclic-nucleotide 2'-phosphodiesterase (5'-nucleotidase family) n=1 Tax=Thiogranum longum TaxID=1537524 RepID=A0A4R1HAH9_9GAMM|nr:5'-nucleotidase C-terminal domain-containing protein [Thiogranum longum]TCK18348.1 2',3'-cyclic-nucleotide 2'-phosphodiesterase (5'-nucleotidase family) [Thiogranum longum]